MSAWLWTSLAAVFASATALLVAIAGAWRAQGPIPRPAGATPLPWPWRLGFPVAVRLAPAIDSWISAAQRARLNESLARAGLDHALQAPQLVALQCSAAAAVAGMGGVAVATGDALSWPVVVPAALLAAMLPRIALRDRIARRRHRVLRQLPHDLDLITLSIEAGLNLGAALGQAARHGPPGPLRDEWQRVLRDVHAGQPRHDALREMAGRLALPAVSNLVAALLAAERQGASLAPVLRAQADQRRTERFLRAERLAMEAPVKMLFPLVLFIFPGTFAILLFPVLYQLLQEGLL